MATKVNSVDHLTEMLNGGNNVDFFICSGPIRSSKNILLDNGVFDIFNEIDDSYVKIPVNELAVSKDSNIGVAIKAGRFYRYE